MLDTHLTEKQVALYRQNALEASEWFQVGEHLAQCDACRLQVREGNARSIRALAEDLVAATLEEESHLDYEDMVAYVHGTADEVIRGLVETHLQHCAACVEQVKDLRAFQALLSTYPAETAAPEMPLSFWARLQQRLLHPENTLRLVTVVSLGAVTLFAGMAWVQSRQRARSQRAVQELARLQRGREAETQRLLADVTALQRRLEEERRKPAQAVRKAPVIAANAKRPQPTPESLNTEKRLAVEVARLNEELKKQRALASKGPHVVPSVQGKSDASALAVARPAKRFDVPIDFLKKLNPPRDVLAGSGTEPSAFALVFPLHTRLLTSRPLFQWKPLKGATGYRIEIKDSDDNLIPELEGATAPIQGTHWMPTRPLARGKMYKWWVHAILPDSERLPTAPGRGEPEARFEILSASKAEMIATQQYTLGTHYLASGLLEEGKRLLEQVVAYAPDTRVAHKAQVLLRRLAAQYPGQAP